MLDGLTRDLDRRAVVGLQHEQPVGAGVGLGEEVGERGEVLQRLRHLLARDLDERVVHPVPREPSAQRDGLGAFVLVVGELQVEPAGVEVEVLAQEVEAHDHALGVPARPAVAPG